jgi:multidrug efflux pump subunit AcrA (membrane-fusion protein)
MKPSKGNKAVFAFVLMLALLCGAFFLYGRSARRVGIQGTVERQSLLQRVTIAGTVSSRRRTLVTGPYNGYVKQIFVKVGDTVKPGQPLVSVAQSLQSSEPVFPLRAPYAGTVMHIQKHEGEYVKENDPQEYILRIDDLSQLYLDANAPEAERAKLKTGQEVVIKVSALPAKTYTGKITELTLAPQIEQSNSRYSSKGSDYPVRIEITSADAQLGPGMSAVVDIITAKQEGVLALRHEFIYREDTNFFVMTADGQKRKIEVGSQNDEIMEIKSGVSEGEKVTQVDFTSMPVAE